MPLVEKNDNADSAREVRKCKISKAFKDVAGEGISLFSIFVEFGEIIIKPRKKVFGLETIKVCVKPFDLLQIIFLNVKLILVAFNTAKSAGFQFD